MLYMALWGGWEFQNLVSLVPSFLESLHDLVMVWLTVILTLVTMISILILVSNPAVLELDSLILETMWTLIPMAILLTIALPSIKLLSSQDTSLNHPFFTIKVIGNQWNWQSESWAAEPLDHLLDPESFDTTSSQEVPVPMSVNSLYRVLVTSTDVLHSLGLPSLGIKLDATPGRLNATTMESVIPGLYLGSCFELCGSGHSMMPLSFLAL